jgi:hypothetical protein
LLAAVGRRVGAEDEWQETASFFQPCPDAPGLTRRVKLICARPQPSVPLLAGAGG